MYRSFLSWRYLFSRRTNLIGMVGILVAVAALIGILSIMTGFLEESRKAVRGTLSDVVIEPYFERSWTGQPVPTDPERLVSIVNRTEGVAGATPQILWYGMVTQGGLHSPKFEQIISSSTHGGLLAVQLVGIDVRTADRIAAPLLRAGIQVLGGIPPDLTVYDELLATDLLASLTREQGWSTDEEADEREQLGAPVATPLFPFQPPADYRPEGRPKSRVVVGQQLFRNLGLWQGDEIQIATAVPDPESGEWKVNNREFVIAGTFRSGENETDLGRIYMERAELSDLLGGTREFTQVLVKLEDYRADGERVSEELRGTLAAAGVIRGGRAAATEVRTWEEFRGNLLGAIENERTLMAIMLSLVLVVAGFTVFAILSMMVTEKRRDIGVLLALGATSDGVLTLFLMIAFWDALIGAVVGATLGIWGALKIDAIERALSDSLGYQIFNRDVYLFDHIPSIVQPFAVTLIVLGAFTCALLFAAIPAWRAARLDPLEALRYE